MNKIEKLKQKRLNAAKVYAAIHAPKAIHETETGNFLMWWEPLPYHEAIGEIVDKEYSEYYIFNKDNVSFRVGFYGNFEIMVVKYVKTGQYGEYLCKYYTSKLQSIRDNSCNTRTNKVG